MAHGVPLALTQNLRHNRVLHENVLLVAVAMEEIPRVQDADRVSITRIGEGLTRVELHYGSWSRRTFRRARAGGGEAAESSSALPPR